ncbi:uncharacterized protein TNCV_4725921 [Trichonephila clavipes]|nr:uncharacterized protein TNCV_4725921 [Trichonephila clavipes]
MAVYFWVPGLIYSPQSHIIMSVMFGLAFVAISSLRCSMQTIGCDDEIRERLYLGIWTVKTVFNPISGQVFDAGHDDSRDFLSAEWHDGDWLADRIREAWLRCFFWVENF